MHINDLLKIGIERKAARLRYRSARADTRPLPLWVDEALRRALHPDPLRRYDALSELLLADQHLGGESHRHTLPNRRGRWIMTRAGA